MRIEGPGGVTWLEVWVSLCVRDPRPGALNAERHEGPAPSLPL